MKRPPLLALSLAIVLGACSHTSPTLPPLVQSQPPSLSSEDAPAACAQRAIDTAAKLDACITQRSLWQRLAVFQHIADANKGRNGHGNRDTGTSGYLASVQYVAKLMRQAGYAVAIQRYDYRTGQVAGTPSLRTPSRSYAFEREWFVARHSAGGSVTASVEAPAGAAGGCSPRDFANFKRGNVALVERGDCALDTQVSNAQSAGAAAVVAYAPDGEPVPARLDDPANVPVVGYLDRATASNLAHATVRLEVRMQPISSYDYNVIADSPYGDRNHVVTIEGHLDAIFGAGMLDNASGSTTMLEIALGLAKTPTHNQLRYIWFGGEELGLLGSHYYTTHLTAANLKRIAFDVDVDVTATPNFDVLIAAPGNAHNAHLFPPNVVPGSKVGNEDFANYFQGAGIVAQSASFGNDGTDSNSFSLVGIPNTGILTNQDCCKHAWEVRLWGGFRGNYEGTVPGDNGGCVDYPNRWCDNLSNNDPFVLTFISKAVAHVTFELANDATLNGR